MAEVSQEAWEALKRNANFYFVGHGIDDDEKKTSLFLFKCGEDIQELFEQLPKEDKDDTGKDRSEYETCIAILDKYFKHTSNKYYERHVLRKVLQYEAESVERFVSRLRSQAAKCKFDHSRVEEELVQQLIEGCKSEALRTKLLTNETSLDEAIMLGKTIDRVQNELKDFKQEQKTMKVTTTNPKTQNIQKGVDRKCYNCGRFGHMSMDPKCTAANVEKKVILNDVVVNERVKRNQMCLQRDRARRSEPVRQLTTKRRQKITSHFLRDQNQIT